VGGDGAGKTTALEALHGWLSKPFDTRLVHMGKPPWSLTTRLVRGSLKLLRLARGALGLDRAPAPGAAPSGFLAYRAALWSTCDARDRYLAYRRARRFATNGGIVICDRFPLPRIELMDAPAVRRHFEPGRMGLIPRLLDRVERRYYTFLPRPELLLVLRLDPETAVARKTDETPESVYTRTREVWECDWTGSGAHVLDASRSREEVLAELKALIWSAL
jgi:thymidylate kinase